MIKVGFAELDITQDLGGYEPNASNPLCGNPDLGERIASESLKLMGGIR